jgi:hypothetical protein
MAHALRMTMCVLTDMMCFMHLLEGMAAFAIRVGNCIRLGFLLHGTYLCILI